MMRTLWTAVFSLVLATLAQAADVTLVFTWLPNQEADFSDYRLYRSTVSGQYGDPLATVTGTTYRLVVPQTESEQRLFFVATARDKTGNEGALSVEISKVIPALPSVPATVPTVTLSVVPISPTQLSITWPPIDPLWKVDVRVAVAPILWGSATSALCPSSPCTISGLAPDTLHEAQAVPYLGELNQPGRVFGEITLPVSVRTLPVPVLPMPGLSIVQQSPTEVVITAPTTACPRIATSTKGSTATMLKRTVRCLQE